MSTFSYADIVLKPVLTQSVQRRMVYDGPTYLYTRWLIRVQGLFNPQVTSYSADAGTVANPNIQQGNNPAFTDSSIRHKLAQPQQRLLYTAAGEDALGQPMLFRDGLNQKSLVILQCPAPNQGLTTFPLTTDANWGPTPIAIDVKRVGIRTWWIDYTVQCDVNECVRVNNFAPFVLSNRWTMSHSVNEHHYTTRTVQGRAIFRTDLMKGLAIRPDDYRAAFFFPCPKNFKRENVQVRVNQRGNELHYSFTDREQVYKILVKNVTKIKASITFREGVGSLLDRAEELALAGKKLAISKARSLSMDPAKVAGHMTAAWIEFGVNSAMIAKRQLPTCGITANVEVWGNRNSTRKELENVVGQILKTKLPEINALGGRWFGVQQQSTYDLMAKYVSNQTTFNLGPVASMRNSPGIFLQGVEARFPQLLDESITDVIATGDQDGYTMPGGSGSRGTYLERCVAQALQDPCGAPPTGVFVNPAPDLNITGPNAPPPLLALPPPVDSGVYTVDQQGNLVAPA